MDTPPFPGPVPPTLAVFVSIWECHTTLLIIHFVSMWAKRFRNAVGEAAMATLHPLIQHAYQASSDCRGARKTEMGAFKGVLRRLRGVWEPFLAVVGHGNLICAKWVVFTAAAAFLAAFYERHISIL